MLVGWMEQPVYGKNTSQGWIHGSDYFGDKNLSWMGVPEPYTIEHNGWLKETAGIEERGNRTGDSTRSKTIRLKSSTTVVVS